jgi:hypothetical protein
VFEACACYYEPMDFILYLQEDVPYRADRIDHFLTLLWHPYEPRAIGIKLKGARFIFQRIQAIFRSRGEDIPDSDFMSLVTALEVAMTAGAGAAVTGAVERKRLDEGYQKARELIGNAGFSTQELAAAA